MSLERLFKTHDRTKVRSRTFGRTLEYATGSGLFSADRIDDGTKLLLEHLPTRLPARVLDVGCGYGALGLPIAALHGGAQVEMVDRDLVAIAYAERNARENGLENARAYASLGYRDVSRGLFDWILCNVPARIGFNGVDYLLREGASRLTPDGSLRVVVIRALKEQVRASIERSELNATLVAEGSNHVVYEVQPRATAALVDHLAVYDRDTVTVEGVTVARPHDISEDPEHAELALPLLTSVLPKRLDGLRCLLVRGGYGALLRTLTLRGADVTSADYDLMNLAFGAKNCTGQEHVSFLASAWPWPESAHPREFDLVVAEMWERSSDLALSFELQDARAAAKAGGEIYWLGPTARMQNVFESVKDPPRRLASRGRYSVFRDAR